MALTLYTTPAPNNWSRNQIRFKVGTDTPLETVGLYIQCSIQFGNIGSPLGSPFVFPLVPDARGLIDVDVSRVVDRLLMQQLPAPSAAITLAATHTGRIVVSFTEYSIAAPSGGTVLEAGEFAIYWGGQSYQSWRGSAWFDNVYPGKKILSWHSTSRTVKEWQPLYFSYLHIAADAADVAVKVTVHFTDSTSEDMDPISFPDGGTAKEQRLYHIAAGYWQLGIAAVNPDKVVHYYTVGVYADTSLISELITCTMDYTADYRRIAFVYFNSLGGLDTITLSGEQNENFNRDFDLIDLNTSRSNQRAAQLPGQSAMNGIQERQTFKGNIGLTEEPMLQDLRRELFLSKGIFEHKTNRWWPVNVLDKTVETGELQAQLRELPIEWSYAFANDSYTPSWQSIGEENTTGIACPVITATITSTWVRLAFSHTANNVFDRYVLKFYKASDNSLVGEVSYDIPFPALMRVFGGLTPDTGYYYKLLLQSSEMNAEKVCTYDAITTLLTDDEPPAPDTEGGIQIAVSSSVSALAGISNVEFNSVAAVLTGGADWPVLKDSGTVTGTTVGGTATLKIFYIGMDNYTIRVTTQTSTSGSAVEEFVVSGSGFVEVSNVIAMSSSPSIIQVLP